MSLGMEVVRSGIESGLLAGLENALVDIGLGLMEHLLDASRMYAAIGDEVFHSHAADFATNRVEARNSDAFGRVVDDEVGAGDLLKRADVAAFATDDAAFEIVRRDMDGGNRVLDCMFGGNALNGQAEDAACALVGLGLGARFGIADNRRAFHGDFVAQVIEQLLLRFLRGHAGNGFETVLDFLFGSVEVTLAALNLALH